MNNENKLTAERIFNQVSTEVTGSVPGRGISNMIRECMERYAAQQSTDKDARIKELEERLIQEIKIDIASHENYERANNAGNKLTKELEAAEIKLGCLEQKLETVKRERDSLESKYNKACTDRDNADGWSTEMQAQRDEAVRYLKRWLRGENRKQLESEIEGFLSRLCSGETKVDDIHVADLVQKTNVQGETKPECKTCYGKRMVGQMTTEGGETWPCPECCPPNNSPRKCWKETPIR